MNFNDVLKYFKAKEEESVESIIPLIEDSALRSAIVAWKSLTFKNKKKEDCQYDDDYSRWNWLWKDVEYNVEYFGNVAGVKDQKEAEKLVVRLIGLRLVYPDGSINRMAQQYLTSMILSKIGKAKPKK